MAGVRVCVGGAWRGSRLAGLVAASMARGARHRSARGSPAYAAQLRLGRLRASKRENESFAAIFTRSFAVGAQ